MKKIIGILIVTLLIVLGTAASAFSSNYSSLSLNNPPETFDLRDVNGENYVTSVKDQNPHGTCWAHAIMASIESNLLISGKWTQSGEESEPDLSESHIDWWNGFNNFNNDDVPDSEGLTPQWGLYIRLASAYLARGEGPIREIDAPYDEILNTPERKNPDYHYYYVRDIEIYEIGENLENINLIKNKIMRYGAINIGYTADNNEIHYQHPNDEGELDHNVVIIGWDDNKITLAPDKGAWLCKNSWGTGWGLDGFFWISYYDKYCCQHHIDEWTASFQNVEPMSYKSIYYHDYHGWQDELEISDEAFNSFTSMDDEVLTGVSFYTCTNNVDYNVRIYDKFENGELSEELSSVSGSIDYMGFHTIDLLQPVKFKADDLFYIYLSLSEGGLPYDRTIDLDYWWSGEITIESVSHPGESYYYSEGIWNDLYDFDNTANFCIKGLISKKTDLNCIGDLSWSNVNPGSMVTSSIEIENVGESFSKLDWEISEYLDWGTWTFTPEKGDDLLPEQGTINVDVSVVVPDEQNKEFSGELKIVNKDDNSDYEIIQVSITTHKNKLYFNTSFLNFLEQHPRLFPILRQLLELES